MIVGIVGLCTGGTVGIIGLIMGIVATKQIDKSGGILKGRQYAKIGIITSIVSIVLFVIIIVLGISLDY
ncbi:MAG: DUF4190 domain-containing protein, partial [Sedimentisphaerales bacterium]|nr:DUF4190 domain-containing protein [Sedimentisphaerales bacterium]